MGNSRIVPRNETRREVIYVSSQNGVVEEWVVNLRNIAIDVLHLTEILASFFAGRLMQTTEFCQVGCIRQTTQVPTYLIGVNEEDSNNRVEKSSEVHQNDECQHANRSPTEQS